MNPSCNIFVSALPRSCDDAMLKNHFSAAGEVVSAKVMMNLTTNTSKCYGFVLYKTPAEAQTALQLLHKTRMDNCVLRVSAANHVEKDFRESNKLYVKNIPAEITSEDLTAAFSKFGTVYHAEILRCQTTNASRGVGFVTYGSIAEARSVVQKLNGTSLWGSQPTPLHIRFAAQTPTSNTNQANAAGPEHNGMPLTPGSSTQAESQLMPSVIPMQPQAQQMVQFSPQQPSIPLPRVLQVGVLPTVLRSSDLLPTDVVLARPNGTQHPAPFELSSLINVTISVLEFLGNPLPPSVIGVDVSQIVGPDGADFGACVRLQVESVTQQQDCTDATLKIAKHFNESSQRYAALLGGAFVAAVVYLAPTTS